MTTFERVAVMVLLGAAVIGLIMFGDNIKPVVGTKHEKIPDDRLNKSPRADFGFQPGPAYLLSNLPAWRRRDDTLPLAADGSVYVTSEGQQSYGD